MNIKGSYILIGVMAVIILLMLYCSPNDKNIDSNGGEFIEHKTVIDTTYIVGRKDTTVFDTVKRYVEVPIYTPVYDTIKELNIYDNPYEDSLISGLIHSEVDGQLVWQTITYTPKFPKYITQTDTLKIHQTDSITITKYEPKKVKLYAGFEFGGNPQSFSASPFVSLADKRNNQFSFRYDIINNTYNVGYQRKIKFK